MTVMTEYVFEWEIDEDGDIAILDPSSDRIREGYRVCLTPWDVEEMMKGLGNPTTTSATIVGGGTTDD